MERQINVECFDINYFKNLKLIIQKAILTIQKPN